MLDAVCGQKGSIEGLGRRNHACPKELQAGDPGREQGQHACLSRAREMQTPPAPFLGHRWVSSCHEDTQAIHAFVIFLLCVSNRGNNLDVHPLVLPSQ